MVHIFILENVFNISDETYKYLSDKFVPHFIEDKNTDVQKEATEVLKILIQIRMTDEKMQHDYALHAVDGMKESDSSAPIIIAIALIGFVQFTKKCPEWLPLLFEQIERKFHKHHPLSKMIENATKEFFKRYQYYDIPEIDEFRYLCGASYIC